MSLAPEPPSRGREGVWLRLVAALGQVESQGAAVGVAGEPGIGKSTLLQRLGEQARAAGFVVLDARGSQSEAHLPYANLHQLLRTVLPRVHDLPARQRESLLACFGMVEASDVNPLFTHLAVLELLARVTTEAPVLLSLDDAHWMDRPTLETLAFVARRISTERMLMVGTARSDVAELGDEQAVTWLELPGLLESEASALLSTEAPDLEPNLRDRVLHEAGGNPLALVEFAKALRSGTQAWTELDQGLPMTTRLERAFATRAEGVDPGTRAVLDVAALDDGDDLSELVAAGSLVGGSAVGMTSVRAGVAHGLLAVAGSTYSFTHPLIASALRQVMSDERRESGHVALASVLSDQPERAIWHRASAMAGRDESVAADLERSASVAAHRGAFSTAVARLERSAALSPDPQDQGARLLSAAELDYELGRFAQVEQIKARLTHLSLRGRDRSRLIRLEGVFHDGANSEPAEVRHLVDLARRASRDHDPDLAMQLLFGAARRVWWRDPGDSVRGAIIDAAREVDVPSGDPRLLAVFGLAESFELSQRVLDELADQPVDTGRADLSALLGIAAFCAGDFVRAESSLSLAIHDFRTEGRLSLLAEALAIRAWAEINLGIFDASRSADEGIRLGAETGQQVWASSSRMAVAVVDAVGGRWHERHPLVAAAERTAMQFPNASSSLLAGTQLARGLGELSADRPDQAFSELVRIFEPGDAAHQRVQQVWTASYLAEAGVRSGRVEEARSHVDAVERQVNGTTAVGTTVALDYCRAVLADDATTEPLFQSALAGAGGAFPWHRARLQLAYGSWLRRQRRVTESRDPLRAARTAFEALGATPWAVRSDQELRATGERGWQPTPNQREHLSPQEAQIAALAARGLSNREIGQRLFLSHRTVGSHLYRVFPKLGVTSRQQLAQVLAGPHPTGEVLNTSQSSD